MVTAGPGTIPEPDNIEDKLMKRYAFVTSLLLWAMPALALTQIAYVSATGSDANTCVLAAPCATWTRAISQTVAGGEIVALTSGDFGRMHILRTVNITVPRGLSVRVRSMGSPQAVHVMAGPSDVIRLKGLHIDGKLYSGFQTGVWVQSAGRVEIQDTRITGWEVGVDVSGNQIQVHLDNVQVSDFVDGGNGKAIWLRGMSKMTLRQTQLVSGDIGFAWDDGHVFWSETASTTTSAIAFTTTPVKIKFTPPDGYFVGCGTLPNFQGGFFNGPMIGNAKSDASNAPCTARGAPWDDGF
jgi:hypothetical protein